MQMKKEVQAIEVFMGILIGLLSILLVLIPVGCVSSFKEHVRLQEEMKADNCQLVSKEETGKTIYCGKACWRKEIREEFSCNSGSKIILN